jgi:hypothetical protein
MSLDPSLADQRRMLRDQWARNAALLCQPADGHAEASLQASVPVPGRPLPDVAAVEAYGVRVGRQIPGSRQGDQEPERRLAGPPPGARALWPSWQCPEGLPDGQREVLQLLRQGRVDLAAVLASRDADARALRVRDLLDADRHVGPARTAAVMQAAGVGDVYVSELAPAHRERLVVEGRP